MLTSEQQKFLAEAETAAVVSERQTQIPASLTLAQAIYESGWGSHMSGTNNCFGIKAATGGKLVATTEYFTPTEAIAFVALGGGRTATLIPGHTQPSGRDLYSVLDMFANYPSLAACFAAHATLLTQGRYFSAYQAYLADNDVAKFILAIGPIYATAPGYGQTILTFAQSWTVQAALRQAILEARYPAPPIVPANSD